MSVRGQGSADSITSVPGVRVGHAESEDPPTGVTVVRFAAPAPTVALDLGGACTTYDATSLSLRATFGRRWAIFLSGGSAYGLDAARGVRTVLLEDGDGHRVFSNPTRIAPISGAALFDLPREPRPLADYEALGRAAAHGATRGPVVGGPHGAGRGARVGKYLGRGSSSPGGIGSAARYVRGLGRVGALAVVNSVGAVFDPETRSWVAGARDRSGRVVPPEAGRDRHVLSRPESPGTTLVVVCTDAAVDRAGLARLALIASTGVARTVIPAFTATDGDVLFAASTRSHPSMGGSPGRASGSVDDLGLAAAEVVARSILRAVRPPAD